MLLRASDKPYQIDTSWPLTPLFCALSVGLTSLSLMLVSFEGMILVMGVSFAIFYALEKTSFVQSIYRRWQSVMMMVASGQIGMCIGAWWEFGLLGLLNKYAICANLPGYGFEVAVKTLTIAPFTHIGMFVGCVGAALLLEPRIFRNNRKLLSLILQTALFIVFAIIVSKWASLIQLLSPYQNYILQILAMHLSMSLCMILAGLVLKRNKSTK